jgi:glucose/arabinose dehydrogenase
MPLLAVKRILLLLVHSLVIYRPTDGLPTGFIDEGVANLDAITGAFAPNPRNDGKPMLLLSSKKGKIMVLEDPDNSDENIVIADLESIMCHNGERGLQSIRPHPNFSQNRYIYMFYMRLSNDCIQDVQDGPRNRLSRFTMDSDTLEIDLSTEKILMETPPMPNIIHNGGNIAFGNDQTMYVTTGDGGTTVEVSQDLGHLHGKILRLNDDGTIPSDNPYASGGVECGTNGQGFTNSGAACAEV